MSLRKKQLLAWFSKTGVMWPTPFDTDPDGADPSVVGAEWVNEPTLSSLPVLRCRLGGTTGVTSDDWFYFSKSSGAAKTTAERQRAFRASLKQQGLTEVRGIFAKPDQHQVVKEAAKKLLDSLATPPER
jgi:hypothetical protein